MPVRPLCLVFALLLATPAFGQQDETEGPLMAITAEQSDVHVDAPQLAAATATFHRQTIHRERGLRDLAIYRGKGEIAAIMYDTIDGDLRDNVGMEPSTQPIEVVKKLKWFLPKGHRVREGERDEYRADLTSYPYQRLRIGWGSGGLGDCIAFLRVYDRIAKRLSGLYCRTELALDQPALKSFLDGIKTKK